jgi:hypothetical protein
MMKINPPKSDDFFILPLFPVLRMLIAWGDAMASVQFTDICQHRSHSVTYAFQGTQ